MMLKVLILSACLAFWVEATVRFPLKVHHQSSFQVNNLDEEGSVPSSMLYDGSLIIEVTVNDAKKPFNVILDTMSDSFWIVGDTCKSTFCARKKQKITTSNSGKSVVTSHSLVEGIQSQYKIKLDGINEEFSTNITAATTVSYRLADRLDSNVDGVLGLKSDMFQQILRPNGVASIVAAGKNPSLYLGIPQELVVQNIYNRARYIYSLSPSQWKIDINYVSNSMGEWNTWCTLGCAGVLDSTFNGISGPAKDIDSINAYIGADKNGEVNCDQVNKLMPIIFHIGVGRYKIEANNFILDSDDPFKTKCKSAFVVERSYNNQWRLGLPLFRQYLTVFDFNSKGIAFLDLVENIVQKYRY